MAEKPATNTSVSGQPGGLPSPWRSVAREVWLRLKYRPIRNITIVAVVVAFVVGLGYLRKYLVPEAIIRSNTPSLLDAALSALDEGRQDDARSIAADLRLHTDIPDDKIGIPPYVLGVVAYSDALRVEHERERKAWFLLAANYLDEAYKAGFPEERHNAGLFLLGKSFHASGRYSEARERLEAALVANPKDEAAICRLLTDSVLHEKVPDLAKAFEYNKRAMTDDKLPREERDQLSLTHARLAFELGKTAECQEMLKLLPADSPASIEAMLLASRLLIREGDAILAEIAAPDRQSTHGDNDRQRAAMAKYAEAKSLIQSAQQRVTRNNDSLRQSKYLLGLAYRRLGDFPAAVKEFERARRSHLDTPEGIAAGIEEAELHHQLGNEQDAVNAFTSTLKNAAVAKCYGVPWTNADDIRKRVEAVYFNYRRDERFALAVDLIDSLYALFPDARTVDLQATARQSWGEGLSKQAEREGEPADATATSQSRAEHREAGKLFEKLARLQFATRDYASALWNSAENYLSGQDYDSAVRMYKKCLDSQLLGHPASLVRLGEAHLALNEPAEALVQAQECIATYSKDPFVYKARLIAARANLELEQLEPAKELLLNNLERGSLTPQSREWRESLFLLGRVYYREGVHHETHSRIKGVDTENVTAHQAGMKDLQKAQTAFRECTRKLSEAVQREPDAPEAVASRYMLAQAHLQSAKLPKKELQQANIETTRVLLRREMQKELSAAATEFEELRVRLIAQQEKGELNAVESQILRNCYFGRADALFDMENFEDAIQAYTSATSQYQNRPESLEAFVQIANCHRKLNRPTESRLMLKQARHVLDRIRPDADFLATTRYDRQEWTDLLNWLSQL